MSAERKKQDIPYEFLTPVTVMDAVESLGWRCNGQLLALNSYENRVYQVGLEDEPPLVVKFYRPGRWSSEAIREEHAFSFELAEAEVPVVAPLRDEHGGSLFEHAGFRFALFPRRGGRAPELDREEHLEWLGRFIGRIHMVGRGGHFQHRPRLDMQRAVDSVEYVQASEFLPDYMRDSYRAVSQDLLAHIQRAYDSCFDLRLIRIHGDCHPGNVLWTDSGPHFVDLDDCVTGPAVQDLWMLLSGDQQERQRLLGIVLRGYQQFSDFDPMELLLVEALRSIRMLHYAAWLARRWHDPAFPMAFPWFNTPRYWEEHVQELKEELAHIAEPALQVR